MELFLPVKTLSKLYLNFLGKKAGMEDGNVRPKTRKHYQNPQNFLFFK